MTTIQATPIYPRLLDRSPLMTVARALVGATTAKESAMPQQSAAQPAAGPTIKPEFITAGQAIFTVKSGRDGSHYTFQVTKKENDDGRPPVWFVSLLTGPDNTSDYTYLGLLDVALWRVRLTAKSRMQADSTPVRVLQWALSAIKSGQTLPAGYRIHHEGRCGRCGRVLTVTESVESGLGPECAKAVAAGR